MKSKKPKGLNEAEKTAEEYAKDKTTIRILVEEAFQKAKQNRTALLKVWYNLEGLLRLLKAWVQGRYRKVPWKTLIYGIAALVYFVNPLDVVPDFLPVTGLLDDAAIIAFVLRNIKEDIEEFRDWESKTIIHEA